MPSPTRTGRAKRAPKLDFVVTAEVIEGSIPADSGHCMIADGLKAAMPQAAHITVDLATIRFTDRALRRRYVYLTPPEAQEALLDFDHGITPEPFEVVAYAAQIRELPKPKPKAKDEKAPLPASSKSQDLPISETSSATPESQDLPISAEGRLGPGSTEPRSESALAEKRTYQRATVIPNPAVGTGGSPIKVGGSLPKMGAMPMGTGSQNARAHRTGSVRRFGLRAMGRPKRDSYE